MKQLPPGIRLIQTKLIQLNQHRIFQEKILKSARNESQQKPCVPFPFRSPLVVLRQRTIEGLERLESQAVRINQLSRELEAAVFEFKAIASEINRDWKAIQAMQTPTSAMADIYEYQVVKVPSIQQKPSGSFVLTSRTIDLFKAEREAAILAQTLRLRAKRKRLKG